MQAVKSKLLGLRLRVLWLQHSYRFRWAHRPLCPRFRDGILRIGGVHFCRSCVCLYCGGILCAVVCACFPAVRQKAVPLLLCVMAPTIALSAPPLYGRWPRPLRDLLRSCMGCAIVLCVYAMLGGHTFVSVICAGAMFVFWRVYFAQRRRRRAAACNNCPELGQSRICTGCTVQAAGIRAYETEATDILMNSIRPGTRSTPGARALGRERSG